MAGRYSGSDPNIRWDVEQRRIDESRPSQSADDLERTYVAFRKETSRSSDGGPSNSNVFLQEKDSKVIEKKTLSAELSEAAASSKDADDSIVAEVDEDIASYQARAVVAAAETMKVTTARSAEPKQSNVDREAAMSKASETTVDIQATSSGTAARDSVTETQFVAQIAREAAEDAEAAAASGHRLMAILEETIEAIETHVVDFKEKALAVSGNGTDRDLEEADFYHTMASKYEAAIEVLKRKGSKVEIAVNRLEESAAEALGCAAAAYEMTDEESTEAQHARFSACWSKNKAEAACIVALKKEYTAIVTMKRLWVNVSDDAGVQEERFNNSSSSNEYNQQCENRDRKTRIAHIVVSVVGASLLAATALFKVGSNSFYAVLCLGLLTSGWTTIYWAHKLYTCVKSRKANATLVGSGETRGGFIDDLDKRLVRIKEYLEKHNVMVPHSDSESDAGSWETIRVDDISQHS